MKNWVVDKLAIVLLIGGSLVAISGLFNILAASLLAATFPPTLLFFTTSSFSGLLIQTLIGGAIAYLTWFLSDSARRERIVKDLLVAVPYLWLLVLFLVPFFIVVKISLSDYAVSIPPYTPQLDLAAGWQGVKDFLADLDFENFVFLTTDSLYWKAYLSSLFIAVVSTFLTLMIGYPIAYGMARAPEEWRPTLMMLIILPFWTSFLIRVYAWMGILSQEGFLNQFLLWIGVIDQPLIILNTNVAVYIGIVYTYLPFMVLPVYSALERMDESLIEAAEDLGCSRLSAFWLVTVPLSRNGIIAGCFLVFIPALGEFVIPSLLGGSGTLMIGKVLWEEFFSNRDWPVASAVAVILLLILVIPIVLFQRNQQKAQEAET